MAVHYRNLQTFLELGLELTRVHRVLGFKQAAYLRPYIELCTALRQASKSDFGKRLYKLGKSTDMRAHERKH